MGSIQSPPEKKRIRDLVFWYTMPNFTFLYIGAWNIFIGVFETLNLVLWFSLRLFNFYWDVSIFFLKPGKFSQVNSFWRVTLNWMDLIYKITSLFIEYLKNKLLSVASQIYSDSYLYLKHCSFDSVGPQKWIRLIDQPYSYE